MFVILLGPPGAGKGTQAKLLAEHLGVPAISTGNLFRQEVASGSELGRRVRSYIDAGQLVSDETTLSILSDRLSKSDAADGAVLDGFPRTVGQATALDRLLAARSRRVDRVLDVAVPENVLLERLTGRWTCPSCHASYHEINATPRRPGICDRCGSGLVQRVDDRAEAIQIRLRNYRERTRPLVDYYGQAGVLTEIDGDLDPKTVTRAMLKATDSAATV
ncbi:MAG: adenylate kinase [Chloroflexota bacterium]|nr:MAG: adenylate kinase [Chloroflexota bacterium]